MNKNFSDKSNEYGKRLLSASITREMKENEERINLKKLPVDNMEKNDFIAYMELTLENLIISRYLFDIRDERGSPMRNSIQITRFIIMKSRNHIMGTCVSNRVILCYCNDKESNIILQNLMEELKKNYSVYLKLEENIENHTRYIEKQLLSYIIQFTLVYNLKFDTNSYVLMQTVNVETDTNRDFYSKLNKLCSNNFEDNNLRQEMLNKNVKETFYNNAYNMYGNTITGSMKSLNLNFNKQQKDEYIKCNDFKRDHVKNIDTFLRESSLNYRDNYGQSTSFSGKQEIWNNQHSQGESHDCVTVATDLLHKSAHHPNAVLRPPIIATTATTATGATRETYHQNEDKRLDAYLHAVTATYKSQMEDDARRDFTDVHMFEGLNAQVILSKEFQNFLDNTEEAALYTGGNNQTVDFDRRERKRPNFAVYNNQHSTGESNKNARP
ncbi:conserved Plasmodium protein, unknown function [Plasmodium ovale wallikeri]|uniref:Uncharacterized protein n=1 Tax=Plasmodium ovale wallikeri TaxID=864142 RepID=A0A1A8ZFN2_PLAOA|nr:conserved Plasmodium protein, unknown function [Plasmodium ovale wallikeri]SBT42687.1 conserved Plasmodium protein, unknown function [Plasmodium ovale wallikeri]